METSGLRWIGKEVLRNEDVDLLQGKGKYVGDLQFNGQLFMKVVRSPFPHALIKSFDKSSVSDLPGVVAVYGSNDFEGDFHVLEVPPFPKGKIYGHAIPMIASGVVRYVGEPVAVVVAASAAEAEDAGELLEVEYEPLDAVSEVRDALNIHVLLQPGVENNIAFEWSSRTENVEQALGSSDFLIQGEFKLPRLVASPIEPRGCIAFWDDSNTKLTLYVSSQDPHRPRTQLAQVLGIPLENLRVVVPEVGGAFGSKGTVAPEHALASAISRKLSRPIKWIEDRSENFVSSYQGRGMSASVKLGVEKSGKFTALEAELYADLGAYLYPTTPVVPGTTGFLMTGNYLIPEVSVRVFGVATNKVPTGPYRGAGRPEACYFVESIVELAARKLDIEPGEIRRRNLIPKDEFPYKSPLGMSYDSGNYELALHRIQELVSAELASEGEERRDKNSVRATGISLYVERAASGAWEIGSLEVLPEGKVIARTGSSSHGQGHKTSLAQVVADYLGVEFDDVTILQGDSDYGLGVGTFASRSMTLGGEALVQASKEIRKKAEDWASSKFEVSVEDLAWDGSSIHVQGSPALRVTLFDVAQEMDKDGSGFRLSASSRAQVPGPVFPFGAYAAEVTLDVESGVVNLDWIKGVDDGGTLINPLLAEGQVLGSTLQGVASALYEEMIYDSDGFPKTTSFMDYLIPGVDESRYGFEGEFRVTPTPYTTLGAKGLGESGTIGALSAIANAVNAALALLGIDQHLDPPYSPERIWVTINSN